VPPLPASASGNACTWWPLGYKLAMTLSGADWQRELARTAERGTQRRGAEQRAEGGDDKGAESRARNEAGMLYRS